MSNKIFRQIAWAIGACIVLAACGGGGGGESGAYVSPVAPTTPAPAAYTVLHAFTGPYTSSGGYRPQGDLVQGSDGDFYGMTSGGGGWGSVFKITADGTLTDLYLLPGDMSSGFAPYGSLVQGSDGNFYGMTNGIDMSLGSVFKITSDGTATQLYAFGSAVNDGANPEGSLIQGSDGDFYGMTSAGGANNSGTVFKITASGTLTVLHSFSGGASDGAFPSGNLIQGSDGSFYGMTRNGGDASFGTVFKITPGGTLTVLHSFAGGASEGASPNGSLIQTDDGNFYGMTSAGGADNLGTVFKMTASGSLTVLHSFAGGATDGAAPNGSLIEGSDGNFYGMASTGGADNGGAVFKMTPSGEMTLLHSFAGGPSDGAYPLGSLIEGSDGYLYGMTNKGGSSDAGTVFKLSPR